MLDVARKAPALAGVDVDWHECSAMELPFQAETFDLVVCQQGLQFFQDRLISSGEVFRVLKPGGRFVANTWLGVDRQPVEGPLRKSFAKHLGIDLFEAARPFSLGDENELRSVLEDAGFQKVEIFLHELVARFPSAAQFVEQQFTVGAATMSAYADLDEIERSNLIMVVNEEMAATLAPFTGEDGSLMSPQPTNVAVAHR